MRINAMKIDKNIPMPIARNPYIKLPFDQMQIGDSFFTEMSKFVLRNRMSIASMKFNMRFTGRTVIEDGVQGIRVWRVE
jgi:hypothetical protein